MCCRKVPPLVNRLWCSSYNPKRKEQSQQEIVPREEQNIVLYNPKNKEHRRKQSKPKRKEQRLELYKPKRKAKRRTRLTPEAQAFMDRQRDNQVKSHKKGSSVVAEYKGDKEKARNVNYAGLLLKKQKRLPINEQDPKLMRKLTKFIQKNINR